MCATNLLRIILLTSLLVMPTPPSVGSGRSAACLGAQWQTAHTGRLEAVPVVGVQRVGWHPLLLPSGGVRQQRNPAANRRRWQRRQRQWARRRPPVSQRQRRQRRRTVLRA